MKVALNTSVWPTPVVRRLIAFGHGRLPTHTELRIFQGASNWTSGRAWGRRSHRSEIFIRACRKHRGICDHRDSRGYLAYRSHGGLEQFAFVLWHECRHIWQASHPLPREIKRIRRHRLGTSAALIEVDAQLAAIRALRRFRREWPTPAPSVLPLP